MGAPGFMDGSVVSMKGCLGAALDVVCFTSGAVEATGAVVEDMLRGVRYTEGGMEHVERSAGWSLYRCTVR